MRDMIEVLEELRKSGETVNVGLTHRQIEIQGVITEVFNGAGLEIVSENGIVFDVPPENIQYWATKSIPTTVWPKDHPQTKGIACPNCKRELEAPWPLKIGTCGMCDCQFTLDGEKATPIAKSQ